MGKVLMGEPAEFEDFAREQSLWAELLVQALLEAGVREVVVSPGSRSTHLVLAQARHSALRCIAVADERSASFYALGQARVSGVASALLCTSGSAPGHYLPAVMEASASHIPLLVISANRPAERDRCGAPQTTDQHRLFGTHVRGFFSIPLAEGRQRSRRAASRITAQAVAATCWPVPGPVQIDVRWRKPLEPTYLESPECTSASEDQLGGSAESRRGAPRIHPPRIEISGGALERLAGRLRRADRPLLVGGPAALSAGRLRPLIEQLTQRGLPAALELTSQLRGCGPCQNLPVWMQSPSFRRRLRPDLVLQVGSAPVSSGWEPWIESLVEEGAGKTGFEHWILTEAGYPDPVSTCTELLVGDPEPAMRQLVAGVDEDRRWFEWSEKLLRIDQQGHCLIEEALRQGAIEGKVARVVTETLPAGGVLALGNSLAVRLAETFCGGAVASCGARVLHQRGLNGIDGIVAGVAGSLSCLVNSEQSTVDGSEQASLPPTAHLLIGDVSLQHDLGSLALLRSAECRGLSVVVIDNCGGRIFDRLPLSDLDLDPTEECLFSTPPSIDWKAAASAFGLGFLEATDCAHLRALLSQPRALQETARLIRVVVPSGQEARDHVSLMAAFEAAINGKPVLGQ